jgi:hypothetical protein
VIPFGSGDAVPDAGTLEAMFALLDRAITVARYMPMVGQIVDTTRVSALRQRNTDAEKARIKAGETARDIWPDNPARARQEDTDAGCTVKFSCAKAGADGKPSIDIAIATFGLLPTSSLIRNSPRADARQGIERADARPGLGPIEASLRWGAV